MAMLLQVWLVAVLCLFGAAVGSTGSRDCSFYCFHSPQNRRESVNVDIVRNLSCTHFVYGFAQFGKRANIIGPSWMDEDVGRRGNYLKISHLKSYTPITVLLGIRAEEWLTFLESNQLMERYVRGLFHFIWTQRFDGFMFDFSPVIYKSPKFVKFLQVHSFFYIEVPYSPFQLIHERNMKRKDPIQIVLSVGARDVSLTKEHWQTVEPYVQAVYMVAEDIAYAHDPTAAIHHQALFPSDTIPPSDTISYNAEALKNSGFPPSKIVIGLSAWARTYEPLDPKNTGHMKPAHGYGARGSDKNRTDGILPYGELCGVQADGKSEHDIKTSTSALLDDLGFWHAFTAPGPVLKQKLDWIRDQGYSGVGLSSIRGDDELNQCGEGPMPIHQFVADNLKCYEIHEPHNATQECTRICTIRTESSTGSFPFANLKPSLCSHIIVSSADFTLSGFIGLPNSVQAVLAEYNRWNVTNRPPVLLSVGATQESHFWRKVLETESQRKLLIERIGQVLHANQIDGIDVSWTQQPINQTDGQLLIDFVKELRQTLAQFMILVSITPQSTYDNSYDMKALESNADFIILQGHRFHDPAGNMTGHHSTMFNTSQLITDQSMTLESFSNIVLSQGMPASKIVLGMSAEGISMKTKNFTWSHALGGETMRGPRVPAHFRVSQEQICAMLEQENTEYKFAEDMGVPMLLQGDELVAFDNARSVRMKTTYASVNNLGGVALLALEKDDVHGRCGPSFRLLESIASAQVCNTCDKKKQETVSAGQCTDAFRLLCTYELPNIVKNAVDPETIPFNKCKNIVVEEMVLGVNGSIDPFTDVDFKHMATLTVARQKFQVGEVTMIAAIKCNMGNASVFKELLDSETSRDLMIKNIVQLATYHSFDGVQFKCHHMMSPSTKENFAAMTEAVNQKFKAQPDRSCPRTVSVRIPASFNGPCGDNLEQCYDVAGLNKLDSVVLEPFQSRKNGTEIISPMFSMTDNDDEVSVDKTVKMWLESGVLPSKIIVHIPAYGVEQMEYDYSGEGRVIREQITEPRAQICKTVSESATKSHTLYDAMTHFTAITEGNWITYDTEQTISYRVRYAQREGLGGVGLFTLKFDDHEGSCSTGTFPMLSAIRKHMCFE
uniref:Glyco_18 domain-containing protein n=1 Tax=Steinernema glaseri TaxID=37863 RepID=A0A1I7Z0T9_9BILA